MKLNAIITEIEEKSQKVKNLWDEADKTGVEPDKDTVIGLNKEIEELEKQAADAQEMALLRAKNEGRITAQKVEPAARPSMPGAGGEKARGRTPTLGTQFVESAEWKEYMARIAPLGHIGQGERIQSPKLVIPVGINALITGADSGSGGAFVETDMTGIYETLGRRPLTIRDIISIRTTQSDLVHYVKQLTRVNAAAPVAEATATSGSSGVKPEGGFTFVGVDEPVKTIAEWVAATKQALADAGQMRGIIDQELRADLEEELEDQILTGDGAGANFTGLDAVSGTQDQAWSTNALTTTRKARTLVRTVGRAVPTAYVMNPTDWETMDLLQDNEARYYFGGPAVLGQPRLWGLPVVESEGQPVGNAWVGDWRKAVLWDRQQAMISVSDSHADFFIRNLVAILAELRAAFGIVRPSAFVEVDLTA